METVFRIVKRDKVAEIMEEMSRRLRFPLAIVDREGGVLLKVDGGGSQAAVRSLSAQETGILPIYFNDEQVGSLSAPVSAEQLEAAAFCLENSLRLEAENIDLTAEIVRVYEEQALIHSFSSKLGGEMEVDTICRQTLEEVEKILPVTNISIMLHDQGKLSTRLCMGRDRGAAEAFEVDASSGLLGGIFGKGEPVTICDVGAEGARTFPYPVRSILCVPLVTDGRGTGMLVASDKLSGEEFWSHDIKLMSVLALEVASSIKKAQLYEEISQMFIHTVEALASAIDAKDPYTYGHSNRVAGFSTAICEAMGMNRKEVREVELAAILHDIGKIGTPERILQKPGRLSPEEMARIQEHPAKGAHILANIMELRDVNTWIRHHHEWYDGHGYPDRIAAEDIPVQARILSIADTFDAMTSDRPYRKGMQAEEAIKIMEESKGSQFDPRILRMFRTIYESGLLDPYLAHQRRPDEPRPDAASVIPVGSSA